MADALKRRDMLRDDAILNAIRLEYVRSSTFLTVIRIHFDGYLRTAM